MSSKLVPISIHIQDRHTRLYTNILLVLADWLCNDQCVEAEVIRVINEILTELNTKDRFDWGSATQSDGNRSLLVLLSQLQATEKRVIAAIAEWDALT